MGGVVFPGAVLSVGPGAQFKVHRRAGRGSWSAAFDYGHEGFVVGVDCCGVRLHVPGLARAQDRGVRLGGVLHLLARAAAS